MRRPKQEIEERRKQCEDIIQRNPGIKVAELAFCLGISYCSTIQTLNKIANVYEEDNQLYFHDWKSH